MKKIISLTAFLCFGWAASAQSDTVEKVENKVEKVENKIDSGATKVVNKTAEVASKSKAKVTDEVYKDATGPDGETVYIDNHSRYYWIDKKGHRHYEEKAALKPKDE
jgi:hypothetical protein